MTPLAMRTPRLTVQRVEIPDKGIVTCGKRQERDQPLIGSALVVVAVHAIEGPGRGHAGAQRVALPGDGRIAVLLREQIDLAFGIAFEIAALPRRDVPPALHVPFIA